MPARKSWLRFCVWRVLSRTAWRSAISRRDWLRGRRRRAAGEGGLGFLRGERVIISASRKGGLSGAGGRVVDPGALSVAVGAEPDGASGSA